MRDDQSVKAVIDDSFMLHFESTGPETHSLFQKRSPCPLLTGYNMNRSHK